VHLQRADASYYARLVTKAEDGGYWYLHRMGVNPPTADTGTVLEPHAEGFVVRGAWRVQCPFCGGSQFGDPAVDTFCCCDCGNQHVGGARVRVAWPADADEIETALLARLDPQTMNWYPHEAAEHLHAENVEHGVHDLTAVPKHRRTLVSHLVDAHREIAPAHAIARGTIVHPASEWHAAEHAKVLRTMGKNVSESDMQRALWVLGVGI
jgi:hypothetical protein